MKEQQPRYEITRYDGHDISTGSITKAELAKIDCQKVDHFVSHSLGIWAFRTSAGEWVEHRDEWPGLGPVNVLILQALQLNAGVNLRPSDIAELTGHDGLAHHGTLAAGILRLRKAHEEQGRPWLIQTTKAGGYRARWARARTWSTIELLPGSLPGPRSKSTSKSDAVAQHVVRTV